MNLKTFVVMFLPAWLLTKSTFAAETANALSTSSELMTSHARELFQQANELNAEEKYADACAVYKAAWELQHHYRIAANLGNCEYLLGKYRDATEHLAISLRGHPRDANAVELANVTDLLAKALRRVAVVRVQVVDAGAAEVFIDETPIGRAPLQHEVYVDPGIHFIHARNGIASGYERIDVKRGESRTIFISILPPTKIIEIPVETEPRAHAVYGVGAGLSAALLVGGIVFASVEYKQRRHLPVNDEMANEALPVFTWGFVASGVVGLAAMTTLYFVMPEKSTKWQRVTATIEPRRGGFNVGATMTF